MAADFLLQVVVPFSIALLSSVDFYKFCVYSGDTLIKLFFPFNFNLGNNKLERLSLLTAFGFVIHLQLWVDPYLYCCAPPVVLTNVGLVQKCFFCFKQTL